MVFLMDALLPNEVPACHALILQLQAQVRLLTRQVATLTQQVATLEARLNQNSQNSSQPPSADGYKKQPAFPKTSKKVRGGQIDHDGDTLALVRNPDQVVTHAPQECPCGADLTQVPATLTGRRQVFDLPQPRLEVTEHQQLSCTCPACGRLASGVFPEAVPARAQYGPGVRALVTLLNVGYKVPVQKVSQLFHDLFGYELHGQSVVNAGAFVYDQLAAGEAVIKKQLLESAVAHVDETGLRVAGKLHWLHTFSSPLATYLFIHEKRGEGALGSAKSLLPEYEGWVIHDCRSSYFKYGKCRHGLCGAHLLRELRALEEKPWERAWAGCFRRYLLALYRLTEKGRGALGEEWRELVEGHFEAYLKLGEAEEPERERGASGKGRGKGTPGRNLLERLRKYRGEVLAFVWHAEVPFTNNQAERDLRPAKTKQKVSGCLRTVVGAERYARIEGFLATARKQGEEVFQELRRACEGESFLTHPQRC